MTSITPQTYASLTASRIALQIIAVALRCQLMVVLAIACCRAFGQEMPTPEQIQAKVTLHRAYDVGQETQVSVPIGQVARFDCTASPYLVRTYLVYPATDGSIWICYHDADGGLMDLRSTSWRKLQGSLQQVAETPCLAVLKWELQEQSLLLRFSLSPDLERNQREMDQARLKTAKMAYGCKNSRPFPLQRLSETERLAGFVRLWSEVRYNLAFFERVPQLDWDKVLVEYLPKIQQAETQADYHSVLVRCMALLHDSHTDLQLGRRPHPDRGSYGLPFEVRPLNGKPAVVVRVMPIEQMHTSKGRAQLQLADLKPGEELTHIDGRPVSELLETDLFPYICASTTQTRDLRACSWLLLGEYGSTAALRIKGLDGRERVVTLARGRYPGKSKTPNEFDCRELEDGLVYVNLPEFGSRQIVTQFQEVLPRIRKAKGLLLDIRRNGGGNSANGDAIVRMLIDKPIPGNPWKTPQHIAAFRAWGRKAQWHEGQSELLQPSLKDPFLGPLVVLTGPDTFSAAEDFVVLLHASKRATVVGERTGGSTGQPMFLTLPGGVTARICTKHDTYPDGREFVGVGVIPDMEVHATAADIAADKDVVLEKAVQVLKAQTSTGPT